MEPKKDRMIHNRAIKYDEAIQQRKIAKAEEDARREKLIEAMHTRGVTVYQYGGVDVEIKESTGVKVKINEGTSQEDEDE